MHVGHLHCEIFHAECLEFRPLCDNIKYIHARNCGLIPTDTFLATENDNVLNLVLLNLDINCLCKWCRSRSAGLKKPTDLYPHYLSLSMLCICINNLGKAVLHYWVSKDCNQCAPYRRRPRRACICRQTGQGLDHITIFTLNLQTHYSIYPKCSDTSTPSYTCSKI